MIHPAQGISSRGESICKTRKTKYTDAGETMSTQSDETTPYILDIEQESNYMMISQLAMIQQQINKGAILQNLAEQQKFQTTEKLSIIIV